MTTLILMGIGAALMYFFDPDSGRPRRVRLRDRCTRATTKIPGLGPYLAPDRTPGAVPETPPEAWNNRPPL